MDTHIMVIPDSKDIWKNELLAGLPQIDQGLDQSGNTTIGDDGNFGKLNSADIWWQKGRQA